MPILVEHLVEQIEGAVPAAHPVARRSKNFAQAVEVTRAQKSRLLARAGKPPQGRLMVNDDYQIEAEIRIDFIAEMGGSYEVFATSYMGGEQGEYSLRILLGEPMTVQKINGYLDADDLELEEYGFYEIHTLFLEAGEHIILEMISEQFDTLLMVEGPDGFLVENDDYNEQTFISRIELFAPEEGEYTITTASFEAGGQGSYILKVYSFAGSGILTQNLHQLALR